MEADFSGYATKAGLKCTDGRIIMPDAFKHMDGQRVPLVWQHGHSEPSNVLGHAILEARSDGMYAYGFFNETDTAQNAKTLVQHGDINMLSIYANQLVEKTKKVFHGAIREVSLVLAGANPGALIDNVALRHSDGDIETLDDEAIIYTGLTLKTKEVSHSEDRNDQIPETDSLTHAEDEDEETIKDVYDSMSDKQKEVLHYMVGKALEESGKEDQKDDIKQSATVEAADTDDNDSEEAEETAISHTEGSEMTRNVFEQDGSDPTPAHTLSHADIKAIVADAQRSGSLKAAVESYALSHGIENIDVLFPDAKMVGGIELDSRRTEWVSGVLSGVRKSPFSRVKSASADLTYDDARAKGYVKGAMKKEEFFSVSKRETTPQTVYKKQKLDRDDIIDITDLDVVAFMKGELRIMLEEELARAILIGDGRDGGDEDKIQETKIRPIATDHSFYAVPVEVNLGDANSTHEEIVDAVVRSRRFYKGSGRPTFYTSETVLAELMLLKDADGYRLYKTEAELANALRVSKIVEVEAFDADPTLLGIVVNPADYVVGADKGGETTMFDDFDIDYNQYKYLLETRVCGALTKPHSALVIRNVDAGDTAVVPTEPAWDPVAYEVTIPTQTGVVFQDADGATLADASVQSLAAGDILKVYAVADTGYFITPGSRTTWSYLRPTGS